MHDRWLKQAVDALKKLDRFILREMISDGAAGTVYKADEILPGDHHRTVALKVLPAIGEGDRVAEERFYNEVKVLAQLAVQPNVVTIYAMGLSEGYPWLAMEYAEGTCAQRIAEEPGDPSEVARLIEQVSRGLMAMHQLQPPLVHQDLKPGNILVDGAGNYKITDFSLASVVSANRTHGLATVRYAAPELLSGEFGKVGPATDLYALGHIAYEMGLGNRLHRQQFKAVFEGNTSKEPPPTKWMSWHHDSRVSAAPLAEIRRDFPPALSDMIARLMAKPIAQRYASAQEVLGEIRGLGEQRVAASAPASISGPSTGPIPLSPTGSPSVPEAARETASTPRVPAAKPAQSAAISQRYWVRLRGRVTGPYDAATLQRQIRQGQLSRLHQVSTDQVTWKAASEIEALYGPTIV